MNEKIVFLFAHQDDEFAVFHMIKTEAEKGNIVFCFYLTDGANNCKDPYKRNNESLSILKKLGVKKENVFFFGMRYCVPDAELYLYLEEMFNNLYIALFSLYNIKKLYIPSWEGGHQDHDAVHFLGLKIAEKLNIIDKTFQFSLYNGKGVIYPFFRVMKPIKENGPCIKIKIPVFDRVKYVFYCLQYPSQWKTWIGLFSFVAFKYLFLGNQLLQNVCLRRVHQKPHYGKLLYEKRNIVKWSLISKYLIKQ